MKRKLPVRVSFIVLFLVFALSLSTWSAAAVRVQAMPTTGSWNGTTSRGHPVSFTVTATAVQVLNFTLKTDFNFVTCSGTVTTTVTSPLTIVNDQFSANTATFDMTGTFTAPNRASGTYSYTNHFIAGCGRFFNQSGTWTAQGPNPTATPRATFTRTPTQTSTPGR